VKYSSLEKNFNLVGTPVAYQNTAAHQIVRDFLHATLHSGLALILTQSKVGAQDTNFPQDNISINSTLLHGTFDKGSPP
jgi:hypothetical protein